MSLRSEIEELFAEVALPESAAVREMTWGEEASVRKSYGSQAGVVRRAVALTREYHPRAPTRPCDKVCADCGLPYPSRKSRTRCLVCEHANRKANARHRRDQLLTALLRYHPEMADVILKSEGL